MIKKLSNNSLLNNISKHIPILIWAKKYTYAQAVSDSTAALIVTLMLVPQALAYAMLAGLPPYIGLYASMLPLVAYAIFGTSSVLAIGPVAIAALMTASAIAPYSAISLSTGMTAAVIMAFISGIILLVAGFMKLGFLSNFLSHPVITGFISAASLVIAFSQLPILLGFSVSGDNVISLIQSIITNIHLTKITTLVLSIITLIILIYSRKHATSWFTSMGVSKFVAQAMSRSIPAILVLAGTILMQFNISWLQEIKTIGEISTGLPTLSIPNMDFKLWESLFLPALLITIVSYVESISVAQNLAVKKKERINPDQELIALGVANIAAGLSSSLPVAGGVSRSVVNSDAGAATPAASILTALGMLLSTILLNEWLGSLPRFILAATIIIAVLSLFDYKVFYKTWKLNHQDFMALLITFLMTLFASVEIGISTGVLLSLAIQLYRTSHPHTAMVGHIEGTEHFRNIDRHKVFVCPEVITLRVDESIYFANAHFLERKILELVNTNKEAKHLILMCSAINSIDSSAIHVLETINEQLKYDGICFHLSEVKGPVMDSLERSDLLKNLNGKVFLTQFIAYNELACYK